MSESRSPDDRSPTPDAYRPPSELPPEEAHVQATLVLGQEPDRIPLPYLAIGFGALASLLQVLLIQWEIAANQYPVLSFTIAPALLIALSLLGMFLTRNIVVARIGNHPLYVATLGFIALGLGIVLMVPTCVGVLMVTSMLGSDDSFLSQLAGCSLIYIPLMFVFVATLPQFKSPRRL